MKRLEEWDWYELIFNLCVILVLWFMGGLLMVLSQTITMKILWTLIGFLSPFFIIRKTSK